MLALAKNGQCECTGSHDREGVVRKLTGDFVRADHQSCGLSSVAAEVPREAPRQRAASHADRHCKCLSAEAVAQALADSILAAERAAVRHPGLSKVDLICSRLPADTGLRLQTSGLTIRHAQA